MIQNFRAEIKFASACESVLRDTFQFLHVNEIVLNKEDNVGEVGVKTAIQFTERDAVRIGNVDFQIPELTDADIAPVASFRQGNETIQGNRFDQYF